MNRLRLTALLSCIASVATAADPIPDVKITLERNVSGHVDKGGGLTNSQGVFVRPELAPGDYVAALSGRGATASQGDILRATISLASAEQTSVEYRVIRIERVTRGEWEASLDFAQPFPGVAALTITIAGDSATEAEKPSEQ